MNESGFFASLIFSVSVTLPTLLMLLLGVFLRRKQMVDEKFCQQATKIIFNITLPLLLFLSVYQSQGDYRSQLSLVGTGLLGTLLLFFMAECFAAKFVAEKRERGTFVQGIYRGNNGILGLAFCLNAYGDAALAPASVYSAGVILIYNVLAVITLSRSLSTGKVNMSQILKGICKNPLILSLLAGILANQFQLDLSKPILSTAHSLSAVTLPLALICTGATINFKLLLTSSNVALQASIGRIIFVPIFMVLLARIFGFAGMELGIILLMSTTPVAAATYAMVQGMGGNGVTAANIIGITTFSSMLTSALGLLLLSQIGWI